MLLLLQILLFVIIGMVFLSTLLYSYVEKAILWVTLNTCCRRDRRLFRIIERNMAGHERRNMKTSVMFTLATSFLIFAQSSLSVLSKMTLDLSMQLIGADVLAYAPGAAINEIPIKKFLETQQNRDSQPVLDFAFGTSS
mmetsp:Transcript_29049/g.36006  ORF Transcript_29049/g.36006 Transcript_29049/m.36006 type:complete len:139 (+) Transcript_29049:2084-2500(+)